MKPLLVQQQGVLYLLRQRRGWRVELFDWDGHQLGAGFRLRNEWQAPRALAVDADRRVWIADAARAEAVAFSVFGVRIAQWPLRKDAALEALAVQGLEDEAVMAVAYGGSECHALEWISAGKQRWLRSLGDPQARFEGLRSLAFHGPYLYAVEAGAQRVQVFRQAEFHYCMQFARDGAAHLSSLAALSDGRVVLAFEGEQSSVLLCDARGTPIRTLARFPDVEDPSAIAVEEADIDARARVAVLDRAGARVQIFTLAGTRLGSFVEAQALSLEEHEF